MQDECEIPDSKSATSSRVDRSSFLIFIAPSIFALLTGAMFFDLLLRADRVISAPNSDLAMQFIPWRIFGFGELRHGHLPLWNPHIYGGAPYLAGFQSALLYPPNWLHLILPVGIAINWIVALHVFLAGYFTYLWSRGCQVGLGGSILAGVMFMFSGPYFLHLYAGHLPHLAAMVWTPLLLLSLDKLAETGRLNWSLPGLIAASMQILAGHPQYVYCTSLAMVIYSLIRMAQSQHRLALASGLIVMYGGAALVTAIQLFPGIAGSGETVRGGGTTYKFASTLALPPENLITFLVPGFLGCVPLNEQAADVYWGAGYLWEMCLFVSIAGLALAVLGAIRGPRWVTLPVIAMIVVAMMLALGRHTPLYRPMFELLPGYGSFRGTSKFAYLAALFTGLLAGIGFDALRRQRRVAWGLPAVIGVVALLLAGMGGSLWRDSATGTDGWWQYYVQWIASSSRQAGERFLSIAPHDPKFLQATAHGAGTMALLAAATAAMVGILLWLSRQHLAIPYALVLLATIELFTFARSTRATMDPAVAMEIPPAWRQPIASLPDNQRVLTPLEYADVAMAAGFDNLNGYDPGVLMRYAQLFFASAREPIQPNQYLPVDRIAPGILRMLRCGLVCSDVDQPPRKVPDPLPPALLVEYYVQFDSRQSLLEYLTSGGFDPSRTVALESAPQEIGPAPGARGDPLPPVTLRRRTTDCMELQADLASPAILLITENYTTGWRIRPIQAAQPQYRVLPANYSQIGIALRPGKHHFLLEYCPLAYRVGKWVSLVSIFALVGASFLLMRRHRWFR